MSAETPDHTPDVSALLPCPKCRDDEPFVDSCGRTDLQWYAVNCGRCLYANANFSSVDEAVADWNTRATPTPADQGDLVEVVAKALQAVPYSERFNWELQARAAIATMPAVGEVETLRAQLAERDETIAGMTAKIAKIVRFTTHDLGCDVYQRSYAISFPTCSCGLEDARKALTPQVPHG